MTDKWDIDETESVFWFVPIGGYCLSKGMQRIFGFSYIKNFVYLDAQRHMQWCTLTEDLITVGNKSIEKLKDQQFRQIIIKGMDKVLNLINLKIKEYKHKDLKLLSLPELFKYTNYFQNKLKEGLSYGIFFEAFDFVIPEILQKAFSKLSPEEFLVITAITVPTFLNIEEKKLLEIALKQKKGLGVTSNLEQHYQSYKWVRSGHIGKKKLTIDYFKERMKHLNETEIRANLKYYSTIKTKKQGLSKKYCFNASQLGLLQLVDEISPCHDVRKETFVKTIYYHDDILEEIGRRLGYKLEDLQYFTLKEILPLKEGAKLDLEELKRRKKGLVYELDQGVEKIYSGDEAIARAEQELSFNYSQAKEIKGTPASLGFAQGKVRIIFAQKDFSKMMQGDILVTGMTRPEYMPIMKKAAAIITDEGGVTCHAAITARELNVPCIIGTRIATKVLKDGDLIEVDANKGIVKKLP